MRILGPLILLAAGAAVYARTFSVPFLYDDVPSIVENPHLRALWPPWEAMRTSGEVDITVSGRPLAALSLALNYAWSGLEPWSYHALNLAIHLLGGLVLFDLARRTLRLERFRAGLSRSADGIALAAALLWVVHPLQTKAVTYVVQRVESLAGLCILVVLAALLRAAVSPRHGRAWSLLAVAACAAGVAVKETAAVAPLLAWLFDRTFLSGSFLGALRARRGLYAGLAASWILAAALALSNPRLFVAQEASRWVSPLDYASLQCWAIPRYLRLSLWPSDLVFDYGMARAGAAPPESWAAVWPGLLLIAALLAATVYGLRRSSALGFLGGAFFLCLAPSSSVVPVALDPIAEHRMYLPLAALALCAVGTGYWLLQRALRRPALAAAALAAACALALGWRAVERNRDYRSAVALWSDTAAKRPLNPRAHTNLGLALLAEGKAELALASQLEAVRLAPDYAEAVHNLGDAQFTLGRLKEAEAAYRRALELTPRSVESRHNLAQVLLAQSRPSEALESFLAVLELAPELQEVRLRVAELLASGGDLEAAAGHYSRALAADPANAPLHNQLGITFARLGRVDEAVRCFRQALALDPGYGPARENLARALGSPDPRRQ